MSDNDGYDLKDDGTAVFELPGGVTRVVHRPTLGQYRTIMESLETIRDPADEQTEDRSKTAVVLDKVVEWLDVVFTTLSDRGLPRGDDGRIDEDMLPVWMISSEIVTDLVAHWQTVPSRRGGR